jgi:hypothetical protein
VRATLILEEEGKEYDLEYPCFMDQLPEEHWAIFCPATGRIWARFYYHHLSKDALWLRDTYPGPNSKFGPSAAWTWFGSEVAGSLLDRAATAFPPFIRGPLLEREFFLHINFLRSNWEWLKGN